MGAASVRLLGLFADRLLRHREPEALLLRGVGYVGKVWRGRALVGPVAYTLFE